MNHRAGSPTETFQRSLEAVYRRLGLTQSGVLLAVSGGTDSLALLLASAALRERLALRLEVASLDHGLREDAALDVAHVRALCARVALPFHTQQLALTPGPSAEERARNARYASLERLRAQRGLDAVATGHTASDQAETLLMRLSRGSALRGAAGILERRERVVRPLLFATREDTAAYLAAEGETAREDPMNADASFFRVRVRREVLPALERAAQTKVARPLAEFAQLAAEDEAYLAAQSASAFARLRLYDGALDAVGVRALPPPLRRRVLVLLFEAAGVPPNAARLRQALAAVEAGRSTALGGGVALRAEAGVLRCVRAARHAGPARVIESAPSLQLEGMDAPPVIDEDAGLQLLPSPQPPPAEALGVALRSPQWPLTVRRRQAGDRIGGAVRRKLQDVLVDAKVPREVRDRLPIVADATGAIVWVVGVWPTQVRAETGAYLWARPLGGQRAQDWLVRYRLRGAVRRPK